MQVLVQALLNELQNLKFAELRRLHSEGLNPRTDCGEGSKRWTNCEGGRELFALT